MVAAAAGVDGHTAVHARFFFWRHSSVKQDDDMLVRPGDLGRWTNMFSGRSDVSLVVQTNRSPVQGLSLCLLLGKMQLVTRPNSGLRRLGNKDDA